MCYFLQYGNHVAKPNDSNGAVRQIIPNIQEAEFTE